MAEAGRGVASAKYFSISKSLPNGSLELDTAILLTLAQSIAISLFHEMASIFEQPRNAGTLCKAHRRILLNCTNGSIVLGGTKISGADVRDQNGTRCASTLLKIDPDIPPSPCDASYSKCGEELVRAFGSRQDDGG